MKEAVSKETSSGKTDPERPDFKMKLVAQMDEAAPIETYRLRVVGLTPSVSNQNPSTRSDSCPEIRLILRTSVR